jgi:hypothetical protein
VRSKTRPGSMRPSRMSGSSSSMYARAGEPAGGQVQQRCLDGALAQPPPVRDEADHGRRFGPAEVRGGRPRRRGAGPAAQQHQSKHREPQGDSAAHDDGHDGPAFVCAIVRTECVLTDPVVLPRRNITSRAAPDHLIDAGNRRPVVAGVGRSWRASAGPSVTSPTVGEHPTRHREAAPARRAVHPCRRSGRAGRRAHRHRRAPHGAARSAHRRT